MRTDRHFAVGAKVRIGKEEAKMNVEMRINEENRKKVKQITTERLYYSSY